MYNKNLTIIITASYIPSHPSIKLIQEVIDSLKLLSLPDDIKIILAHDFSNHPDYIQYLKNITEFVKDKKNFQVVQRTTHGHLVGNVRNALKHVDSEYILLVQHDLKFNKRPIDIMKVVEDMKENPCLKHIRFNKRCNRPTNCDSHFGLFGKEIKAKNFTYTRTNAWSDNNHICPTKYYTDIVMTECRDGKAMEHFLLMKSKNEKIHEKYGTYLFGPVEDRSYINHLDGRRELKHKESVRIDKKK